MLSKRLRKHVIRMSYDLVGLPQSNYKHFSFIVRKNLIVGFGYNNAWKTEPLASKFGHRYNAIHSEVAAIKSLGRSPITEDKVLINVRIGRNGEIGLSKPCKYCRSMIDQLFPFDEVWFSDENGCFQQL